MSAELRRKITDRLLESAQDPDGFLSDGFRSVEIVDRGSNIIFNGTIDVHHIVSEVLIALNEDWMDLDFRNGNKVRVHRDSYDYGWRDGWEEADQA